VVLHKVLSQKGLTENEAIADQCAAEMMPSLEILPARCATSPWVAMLRYDERAPFVSVTSTTTRTLWDLYQMQLYYISQAETARSMGNHRLCKQLMATIEHDPEAQKLELYVKTALDEFLCSTVGAAKSKLPDFVQFMWNLTIRHIHMLERRIHKCCCLVSGTNEINVLLTPNAMVPENFPYDPKTEAQDSLDMQNWFQTKQSNSIAEQRVTDDGKPIDDPKIVVHIAHDKIVPTLQESRNNPGVVWRRFVPWRTLWQYMLFLDFWGLKKLQNEAP
jgi:hypothetical protein